MKVRIRWKNIRIGNEQNATVEGVIAAVSEAGRYKVDYRGRYPVVEIVLESGQIVPKPEERWV